MAEIVLANGMCSLVDGEDFAALSKHKWRALKGRNCYYAVRWDNSVPRRFIYMHRQILGVQKGVLVDHKDGDGLNNQRGNLREATTRLNAVNKPTTSTTGFRGVSKKRGQFQASIRLGKKMKYIGTFDTPEEAASAYDVYARTQWGAFARLNSVE